MDKLIVIPVTFFAGMGVGLGTGFAGMSAAASHFAIGGAPDIAVLALCILFTLIWARIVNKAAPETLNILTIFLFAIARHLIIRKDGNVHAFVVGNLLRIL